ncbi:MAG: hypothetical protein M3458_06490 [Acidobacteriota bacterium]|nr:hypothetical protein [Acidobacteriota bacterium]
MSDKKRFIVVIIALVVAVLILTAAFFVWMVLRGNVATNTNANRSRITKNSNAPNPGPPSNDTENALSTIDHIRESLRSSDSAFNTPPPMKVGETQAVQFLLGPSQTADELKGMITEKGRVETEKVQFSEYMQATLLNLDSGLEVKPVTPDKQLISTKQVTEWRWIVTAVKPGAQRLQLRLDAVITQEGSERPLLVNTFNREIMISVSWRHSITAFISNNYQWLWTAILIPLATLLWSLARMKRNKEGSPDKP